VATGTRAPFVLGTLRDGLPLQVAWVVTALAGIVIVYLFFGDQTPAPPTSTTTGP